MARRPRLLQALALAALVPLVAACENSATAYTIDTAQHAVVLVREQPFFWTRSVNQAVVVSRLPHCQRKVTIHPGPTTLVEMQVYEAGHQLWALRQGERWYLASTENCRVQDWDNPDGQPPGPLVGSFRLADGKAKFVRAGT
jgi:hypothetical protein